MSIITLQERQTQLILQRSHAKDMVEMTERELGGVNFALKELKELVAEYAARAAEAEASTSKDVLADVIKFPTKDNPEGSDNDPDNDRKA